MNTNLTPVDPNEELVLLEHSVRDVVSYVLRTKYGVDWIEMIRLSDRVDRWKEARDIETKRLRGAPLENRLIYYADFYDLSTLIRKHWDDGLSAVFVDLNETEVFLTVLEAFRNPTAHNRTLLEYQKYLLKGIANELRIRIIRYRAMKVNPKEYFPQIESASDSLGHGVSHPNSTNISVPTHATCYVGDTIHYTMTCMDPHGGEMEYSCRFGQLGDVWVDENQLSLTFTEEQIGIEQWVCFSARRKGSKHFAYSGFDCIVSYNYSVLPKPSH